MRRSSYLALFALLALIGLADSWYLFQSALNHTALFCDIGAALDGCNIVAQSPYSRVAGIPLAFFGVLFYGAALFLVTVAARFPRRSLHLLLYILTALGVLASIVFVYIQVALIQALCIYCLISAVIAPVLFLLARSFYKQSPNPQV